METLACQVRTAAALLGLSTAGAAQRVGCSYNYPVLVLDGVRKPSALLDAQITERLLQAKLTNYAKGNTAVWPRRHSVPWLSGVAARHRSSVRIKLGHALPSYGCDTSQDVCPWNVKFSRDATESAYAARDLVASKDARTLATELLAMSQEEFSVAFRKSR